MSARKTTTTTSGKVVKQGPKPKPQTRQDQTTDGAAGADVADGEIDDLFRELGLDDHGSAAPAKKQVIATKPPVAPIERKQRMYGPPPGQPRVVAAEVMAKQKAEREKAEREKAAAGSPSAAGSDQVTAVDKPPSSVTLVATVPHESYLHLMEELRAGKPTFVMDQGERTCELELKGGAIYEKGTTREIVDINKAKASVGILGVWDTLVAYYGPPKLILQDYLALFLEGKKNQLRVAFDVKQNKVVGHWLDTPSIEDMEAADAAAAAAADARAQSTTSEAGKVQAPGDKS